MNNIKIKYPLPIYWFIIFILVLIEAYQLSLTYHPSNIPWDTKYSYLPAAQHFLEQGISFFTTEESLRYPPLTYLYYVPFLDHLEVVRILNNLLAVSSLWFVYQIIRQFSTPWHATMGLLIYVTIPNLSNHWGQLLTEPTFLFLTLVWLWATIKAIMSGKTRYLVLAIVALILATMTRAIYIYFLYFIVFSGCLWLLWGSTLPHRSAVKKLLIICLGTLIFLWLFMLKNWILFGTFSISNGMSAALYQGLHPFLGGIAPPVYGNDYDINAISFDHLSLAAEKRNMMASKIIISERSLGEHIIFFLNKFYLIFLDYQTPISRYWRLGLLPFFVYGLWYARPKKQQTLESFIFFFMGMLLIYQFAILLPILILERYTVVGTTIPLVICSGYIYLTLWQKASRKTIIVLHIISVLLMVGGYIDAHQYKRYWPQINPKAYKEAKSLTHYQLNNTTTKTAIINDNLITIRQNPAHIVIPIEDRFIERNAVLFLNLKVKQGQCKKAQLLETYANQNFSSPLLKRYFTLSKRENRIRLGFFPRGKQTQLNISLTLYCKQNTQIEYTGTEGYYDLTPVYLNDKIDKQLQQ